MQRRDPSALRAPCDAGKGIPFLRRSGACVQAGILGLLNRAFCLREAGRPRIPAHNHRRRTAQQATRATPLPSRASAAPAPHPAPQCRDWSSACTRGSPPQQLRLCAEPSTVALARDPQVFLRLFHRPGRDDQSLLAFRRRRARPAAPAARSATRHPPAVPPSRGGCARATQPACVTGRHRTTPTARRPPPSPRSRRRGTWFSR